MTLRAVYFDFGGVLVRTEDRGPRTKLAESLGLTSRALEKFVFEDKSSQQASVGAISEDQHWQNVLRALKLPESDLPRLREEFFRGDRVDLQLLDALRRMRATVKVGLISNAWSGLRPWIIRQGFDDVFDCMIISAEVGCMKPEASIYRLALDKMAIAAPEAVFVDDMPANVQGAQAVGIHGIQFTGSQPVLEEIEGLLADHR